MNNEAVDVVVTAKGLGSTLTGSGLAIYGGLTANEWALFIGVIIGVGGLCVQIWDKYHAQQERKARKAILAAREKRERERHRAAMSEFERTGNMPMLELPVLDSMGDCS